MTTKTKMHSEILRKKAILDNATIQLKKEFVGIDKVIDEITESVSSWFIFPKMQEKPLIINLWGLTGVGKTSLVKRLCELLGEAKKLYRYDMGARGDNSWTLKQQIAEMYYSLNSKPFVLAFDEFQHAKTKNEMGFESNNSISRIIWDLLDSGRFSFSYEYYYFSRDKDVLGDLKALLSRGLVVEKGRIIKGLEQLTDLKRVKDLYNENHFQRDENIKPLFVPIGVREKLFEIVRSQYKNQMTYDEKWNKMNGPESINFFEKITALSL